MHGLGPGPRREPGGRREDRQKGRSPGRPGEDRFWNPVPKQRTEKAAPPGPALPPADQLELWPEESL